MVTLKNWFLAIRPRTLPAAIAPVMMATAMAFADGVGHWVTAICCLCAALCVQIGTNLTNDYFDFKKGADQQRIGPTRVTQAGLIAPQAVLTAGIISFALFLLTSVYLIYRGGWLFLILALAAVLSGFFYTAGKKAIGYLGLGELFVFIFFGPVAVVGTYYLQSFEFNLAVLVASFAPGLISCAIIAVNNLRDMDGDRKCGKNTLAVRWGRSFATVEYAFLIIVASMVPFWVYMITKDHEGIVIASIIGILSIPLMRTVFTSLDGPALNKVLARTGQLLLIYSVLFSFGWMVCSR